MRRIVFFNNAHLGDLHVGRGFARKICEYANEHGIETLYLHRKPPMLEFVKEACDPTVKVDKWDLARRIDDDLLINTWYGAGKRRFILKNGVSFSCLYDLFEYQLKVGMNLRLDRLASDPREFYPQIDYSKHHISGVDAFMKENKGRKVMICNGDVKSAQAKNFDMSPAINALARRHRDITWIVTNPAARVEPAENVVMAADIIKKDGCDLNENSYMSTFCDVIVGRLSGPHTYTYTKQNLFERKIKILCFLQPSKMNLLADWKGARFRDQIHYKAKITQSNAVETRNVIQEIERQL